MDFCRVRARRCGLRGFFNILGINHLFSPRTWWLQRLHDCRRILAGAASTSTSTSTSTTGTHPPMAPPSDLRQDAQDGIEYGSSTAPNECAAVVESEPFLASAGPGWTSMGLLRPARPRPIHAPSHGAFTGQSLGGFGGE
jgi:hypothetical protein